jgi:metal-responsive CopG/Arc/MetJ family transcriptional regulator
MTDRMVKTTVTIPEDLYLLARHNGLKNLGEFVREALQGFVDGQEEPVTDTVAVRARQIAVNLRLKSLQQRKIIQDAEIDREMRERETRDRAELIRQVTLAEVRAQKFTATYLPDFDDQYLTSEGIRKKLVDDIAHQCQIDLQWKDVEQYVRMAVRV